MTDNRSERLRRRRKQSTARANDQENPEDESSSKPSKRDEPSERSNSTGADAAGETAGSDGDDISIKEEQIGTYMYLPESQTKELRRQYNILKAEYEFEYDEEFEKNRHFYPLVVQYGLESLEEMDASEIRTRLEGIAD